jgi:hypothetical protein
LLFPTNLSGSHYHARWILLRLFGETSSLYFLEKAKVRNACEEKNIFSLSIPTIDGLDFMTQTGYDKDTKFSVV